MLQRIIIENFKAIGNRIEIDLAPITLLVGPNSVGKSSILQAIHYAAEILAGHKTDVYQTQLSGGQLDLGGFNSFVHNGETDRTITLGFEKTWKPGRYEDYLAGKGEFNSFIVNMEVFNSCKLKGPLSDFTYSWRVILRIAHGALKEIAIEINNEPMVRYDAFPDSKIFLNSRHPLFTTIVQERRLPYPSTLVPNTSDWMEHLFREAYGNEYCGADGWCWREIDRTYVDVATKIGGGKVPLCDDSHHAINEQPHQEAELLTNIMLLEPLRDLKNMLQEARHLGPLRKISGRSEFGQVSERGHSDATWYDGSAAAWQSAVDDAITDFSGWLPEANAFLTIQHLMSGNYKFFIREDRTLLLRSKLIETLHFVRDRQLPHSESEELSRDLQNLSAHSVTRRVVLHDTKRDVDMKPQDVGTGISQVFPTLAASLSGSGIHMAMIEQPELHLHPRAQLALGDVFICRVQRHWLRWGHEPENLVSGPEPLIVETHSEHIVLRLLRRIRETGEGKHKQGDPGFLKPDELCVVYIERTPDASDGTPGTVQVRRLRIDPTGEFIDRWPNGFFEDRAEELF